MMLSNLSKQQEDAILMSGLSGDAVESLSD